MTPTLPTQADLMALVEDLRAEDDRTYIERKITALVARYLAYIAIHAPQPAPPIDYVSVIVLKQGGVTHDGL